jgi:hypothetical protein
MLFVTIGQPASVKRPYLNFADVYCEGEGVGEGEGESEGVGEGEGEVSIILPNCSFVIPQDSAVQQARRPPCEHVLLLKTSYLMS